MGTTPFDGEAKVVEAAVDAKVPAAVQPVVDGAVQEAAKVVDDAAAQAPAAEAAAAQVDPAVEQAARDAAVIAGGGAIPLPAILSDATHVVKEVKNGYKTTEFWLTGAVIVLAQVGALAIPGKYGAVISEAAAALSSGLYAISRGIAKK